MKTRPELLLHPTIPPPLHGITPRELLGKKWWDVERKVAYAKHDDCCHACGTHKTKTWYRKYLEAHEAYEIDYDNCTVTLKEVVGLCHSCHNYIHVGRLLKNYRDGVVSRGYVTNVLDWGVQLLSKANLKPQATQAIHWLILKKDYSQRDAIFEVIKSGLVGDRFDPETWNRWIIYVDGVDYGGKSFEEWVEQYG